MLIFPTVAAIDPGCVVKLHFHNMFWIQDGLKLHHLDVHTCTRVLVPFGKGLCYLYIHVSLSSG